MLELELELAGRGMDLAAYKRGWLRVAPGGAAWLRLWLLALLYRVGSWTLLRRERWASLALSALTKHLPYGAR